MAILTFPLSRIEGHARVVIETRHGEVISAYFEAMEIRGFEHFVKGVPAEQMPIIVPRICGVCSTAHHIASIKALEEIYEVETPPLARELRELMLLGQLIQNQASSLFIFTMPDRLGTDSIFQSSEAGSQPVALATQALRIRKAGTDLITLAGGQFIHPIKAVVGGVTSGIASDRAEAMYTQLENTLPVARQLVDHYWAASFELRDRIGTWGDDEPAHYIASTGIDQPDYYGDRVFVMAPDGTPEASFPARKFREHLTFESPEYSYAGQTSYKGNVMRANSLARTNMAASMGTPQADSYFTHFKTTFGKPSHGILLFDLCRGIELIFALERAMEILKHPLDSSATVVPHVPRDGEGFGLVEAPRGPLIHRYVVENERITEAEFVIPTVHNSRAIERALRVAARRYITPEAVNMELERAVGRVVRAFDPCIACATH
jgi:F420-non-reducing hydrogenase large subunit